MSQLLDKFASCGQVTEWLTPHDERLVKVTGLLPPVDGKTLREDWHVEKSEISELESIVKRLLVPQPMTEKVSTLFGISNFINTDVLGTIGLYFEDQADWQQCFPTNEQTFVFERNGVRGNAAIALCGRTAALAVISMEFYNEGELDFVVQPVRQDKFEQILAA